MATITFTGIRTDPDGGNKLLANCDGMRITGSSGEPLRSGSSGCRARHRIAEHKLVVGGVCNEHSKSIWRGSYIVRNRPGSPEYDPHSGLGYAGHASRRIKQAGRIDAVRAHIDPGPQDLGGEISIRARGGDCARWSGEVPVVGDSNVVAAPWVAFL